MTVGVVMEGRVGAAEPELDADPEPDPELAAYAEPDPELDPLPLAELEPLPDPLPYEEPDPLPEPEPLPVIVTLTVYESVIPMPSTYENVKLSELVELLAL